MSIEVGRESGNWLAILGAESLLGLWRVVKTKGRVKVSRSSASKE